MSAERRGGRERQTVATAHRVLGASRSCHLGLLTSLALGAVALATLFGEISFERRKLTSVDRPTAAAQPALFLEARHSPGLHPQPPFLAIEQLSRAAQAGSTFAPEAGFEGAQAQVTPQMISS